MVDDRLPLFRFNQFEQTGHKDLNQYKFTQKLALSIDKSPLAGAIHSVVLCLYYFSKILYVKYTVEVQIVFIKILAVIYGNVVRGVQTALGPRLHLFLDVGRWTIRDFHTNIQNRRIVGMPSISYFNFYRTFAYFVLKEMYYFTTVLLLKLKVSVLFYSNYILCRYLNYSNVYRSLFVLLKDQFEESFRDFNLYFRITGLISRIFSKIRLTSRILSKIREPLPFYPRNLPLYSLKDNVVTYTKAISEIMKLLAISFYEIIVESIVVVFKLYRLAFKDFFKILKEFCLAWLFVDKWFHRVYLNKPEEDLKSTRESPLCYRGLGNIRVASILVFMSWAAHKGYCYANTKIKLLGFVCC